MSTNVNFVSDVGVGTGGDINIPGSPGMSGNIVSNTYMNVFGGGSHLGAMTKLFNTGANSDAAIGSGAAAKGSLGNSSGGVGGRGVVIVEW